MSEKTDLGEIVRFALAASSLSSTTFLTACETSDTNNNIAFARGGAHLPIAHALRLLSTQDEIEIEKK